jgi:YggT family protein
MSFLAGLLANIISLVIILFFARAVISWAMLFGVRNEMILRFNVALGSLTEPIIAPVRRFVPPLGGMDLSYMVAVLVLVIIRRVLLSV